MSWVNISSVVSVNWQKYSWRYRASGIERRSSSKKSAGIRGTSEAEISYFSQPLPSVHSWWKMPLLPCGVEAMIMRPPETASIGRTL